MSSAATQSGKITSLADLQKSLGGIPLDRIRYRPAPSTATVQDVLDVAEHEGILCELIDGVLVEKVMGWRESQLAIFLGGILNAFVLAGNRGIVTGPDGTIELMPNLVRIPDLAFIAWDRIPGRRSPKDPVPSLAPNLAIEILSSSNTAAEMRAKREDYFRAGVELVWEIEPETRSVTVYTSPTAFTVLKESDTLDAGMVLPGFALPLSRLFGELDRQG